MAIGLEHIETDKVDKGNGYRLRLVVYLGGIFRLAIFNNQLEGTAHIPLGQTADILTNLSDDQRLNVGNQRQIFRAIAKIAVMFRQFLAKGPIIIVEQAIIDSHQHGNQLAIERHALASVIGFDGRFGIVFDLLLQAEQRMLPGRDLLLAVLAQQIIPELIPVLGAAVSVVKKVEKMPKGDAVERIRQPGYDPGLGRRIERQR